MEKISLVRRRMDVAPTKAELRAKERLSWPSQEISSSTDDVTDSSFLSSEPPVVLALPEEDLSPAYEPVEKLAVEASPLEEEHLVNGHGTPMGKDISTELPPEVVESIWDTPHVGEGHNGQKHIIVEAQKDSASGNTVLKLQFTKPEDYLRLITSEEVCEMLHITKSTLYFFAHSGRLRSYRMGRGLRFRFSDVLDFLASCKVGRN